MTGSLLPPGTGRAALAALALYVLVTVLVTWPFPAGLDYTVVYGLTDQLAHSAILAWDWRCLVAGDFADLFHAPFFHPYPLGLAYTGHGLGLALLGLPLYLAGLPPLVCHHLLTLAAYPLNALAMFLLAVKLCGTRRGAFLAGLVFAFAPFRLLRLGHIEILQSWGLPVVLLLLWALMEKPGAARALALFLAITGQALLSVYYLVYLMFMLPLVMLYALVAYPSARRPRFWLWLALAAVAAAAVMLPVMLPYRTLQMEMGLERSLANVMAAPAWSSFLGVPATSLVWGRWLAKYDVAEGALFPGLLALLLAGAGLLLRPARPGARGLALLLLVAGLFLVAGPGSRVAGLDTGSMYRALYDYFPGFSGARVATRWHVLTLLGLGLLVAGGWSACRDRLGGRARAVLPVLLAAGMLAESYMPPTLAPFPAALQRPGIISRLRDLPPGAVIQLPLEWMRNLAMYHGITHGKPVVQATFFFLDPLRELDLREPGALPLLESVGVRYIIVRNEADTAGVFRTACAADSRLRQLDADEYGVLFELAGRGACRLVLPGDLADLTGTRLSDGDLLVSLALPGATTRPVISLQRFFTGELSLRAGGRELRRQTLRFELPPFATGTQRAAAIVTDAAATDSLCLTVAGRDFVGPVR